MLDHGQLNIPLSRRGNIDAQIDRWKREQAAEARKEDRSRAAILKEDRARAKAMLSAATDERLQGFAARMKMTIPALRKSLASEAHWQPALIIRLFSEAG